jgi:hypothetical protein
MAFWLRAAILGAVDDVRMTSPALANPSLQRHGREAGMGNEGNA